MPAYLVTKAIASGMFMIMAAVWLLGVSTFDRRTALVGNGIALVFLAITTVLLVADLERPERFLRILTRPQWKSWLTRGAFILIGFSLVCTAWFAVELGAQLGWLAESWTFEQLLEAYPHITRDDILAALAFAAEMMRDEQYVEGHKAA